MKKNNYNIIIIAILFFAFGYFLQTKTSQAIPKDVDKDKFLLFWNVWETLEKKYPFEEPAESDKRYQAIRGLVSAYEDPYSSFFPPETSKLFKESVVGKFAGIGVEITIREGFLMVIAPLKNSPADIAGIKAGDVISKIDGIKVENQSMDELTTLIRGEVATDVVISVLRVGEEAELDITVTRDIINVPVLDTEIIDGVFILSLYNFNQDSEDQFDQALKDFKNSGKKYLLINLYNNPGGFLSSSVDISSYFVEQGKVIVTESFGDSGKEDRVHRSKGFGLLKGLDYELGVLINKGSASASEIVAGALQDHEKAIIIGEKSYGKGSIQEVVDLEQDTSLRVTVGKWLTPNGEHISKQGILPDQEIDQMDNAEAVMYSAVKILKEQ